MTVGNVQGALDELFTSVSDGKALIASAVTDLPGALNGKLQHHRACGGQGLHLRVSAGGGDHRAETNFLPLSVTGKP